MVAHGLAIAVWVGSLALYGAAFFFPEVHRRHDFFWSGVGAFYGLVLWVGAVQISPTELLGHGASLALLGWFGWQTLNLRRKRTPLELQTPLTAESWPAFWENLRRSLQGLAQATPLGRWLPEDWGRAKGGDPAIAVAELRTSSLKDVDYEFVDELAPKPALEAAPRAIATVEPAPPGVQPQQPQAKPIKKSPASPPPAAQNPAVRSQPSPPPNPPRPKPQSLPWAARVAGLQAWLGDLVNPKKTPKPKRDIIEIPPRPSPLGRKQAQREVIDIPPRPSPLDRKKPPPTEDRATPPETASPKTAPPETAPPATVTIVDTAAVESEAEGGAIAPEPATTTPPPPEPAAPAASEPRTDPIAAASESNWDDEESNWAD